MIRIFTDHLECIILSIIVILHNNSGKSNGRFFSESDDDAADDVSKGEKRVTSFVIYHSNKF
jgi:hypothetical protein